jgi:hypothetical protein
VSVTKVDLSKTVSLQAIRITQLEKKYEKLTAMVYNEDKKDQKMEEEEAPVIKPLAMKAANGGGLVHVMVYTKHQRKAWHKTFPPSEKAKKKAHLDKISSQVADVLNEAGVSSTESKTQIMLLGVPKSWVEMVKDRLLEV